MAMQLSSSSTSLLVTQGAVDWTQLAKSAVQFEVSVLGRLAAADISPLTLIVGQAVSSGFVLSDVGTSRVRAALAVLPSFSSIGDVLWFGLGVKHVVRQLAETEEGLRLITLCGCLSEVLVPKHAAIILMDLAKDCGAPDTLRPSPDQWLKLLGSCSATLRTTSFACIAEQFMLFHSGAGRPAYTGTRFSDEDLVKALAALFRLSSGSLISMTLVGARACGWVAAVGHYFLGLDVEIQDADGKTCFRSTDCEGRIHILVLYGDSDQTHVQVTQTTYVIEAASKLFLHPGAVDHFPMCGTVPWESCLYTTFGSAVSKLLQPRARFGQLIRLAGRVFEALARSEPHAISSKRAPEWVGYRPEQFGSGFVSSCLVWFPELARPEVTEAKIPMYTLDEAVQQYTIHRKRIRILCSCICCVEIITCRHLKESDFCLASLADTIMFMAWNLSLMRIHCRMNPYRSGIHRIYDKVLVLYDIRRPGPKPEDILVLVEALGLPSAFDTARLLFTTNLVAEHLDKCTALSVRGMCFYLDILSEISDRPEQLALLHVMPGCIETASGCTYSQLVDGVNEDISGTRPGPRPSMVSREFRKSYFASMVQSFVSVKGDLALDTGSQKLKVSLVIHESIDHLYANFRICGEGGVSEVGISTLCDAMLSSSGLVHCTRNRCPLLDRVDGIYAVDGEGNLPEEPRDGEIFVYRLSGNTLARCVAVLAGGDGLGYRVILRRDECADCCVRAAGKHGNIYTPIVIL